MSPKINIKERILLALESGYLMSLGTVDHGGVWVADVIYIFDDELRIYWMSDPDVRHSEAILENKKVAGSITMSAKGGEKNLGIQFEGNAEKIEGARFDLTQKHFLKRGKSIPKESDDVLQGDSWYMITPTKIELIDEANFGYTKKALKLS